IKFDDSYTYTFFFFSSRRRHTRSYGDWSSDVCSSDLADEDPGADADGDEKQVDEATGHAHARESRGGRSHRSYILRARRAAGRWRRRTLREQIRDHEKQGKAGQNLFHVHLLTDFSHPLST